jgi:hypothetical protein
MSTSIDQAFITDYNARVHEAFQRRGGKLLGTVRHKPNVVGSTSVFFKIGAGVATTKARHGVITPMNQVHTAPTATLVDFYAGDWVDKLDEAKINIDEKMAIANAGAWALGRKVDDQILTAMDATSQSTITFTITSYAAIFAGLITFVEALDSADVPDDGERYVVFSPRAMAQSSTVEQFTSADYVDQAGNPFKRGMAKAGRWRDWMGVKWGSHTGVPGKGTATSKGFIYHKSAIGYASAKAAGNIAGNEGVAADITWHGDRAAHFVNHLMSGGAVLIDDPGCHELNLNDTTAIATS